MKNQTFSFKELKNKFLRLFKKKSVFKKSFQKIPRALLADKIWKKTLMTFVFLLLIVVVSGIGFFYYINYSTDLLLEINQQGSEVVLKEENLDRIKIQREENLKKIMDEVEIILPPEVEIDKDNSLSKEVILEQELVLYPGLESIIASPDFE